VTFPSIWPQPVSPVGTRGAAWLLAIALFAAGCAFAGYQEGGGMETIEGSIWHRERVALPLGAKIHVYLEDVARMDVPSEVVTTLSMDFQGGPPWLFALP
jgi:uncharacterized lipoprotein YbaY